MTNSNHEQELREVVEETEERYDKGIITAIQLIENGEITKGTSFLKGLVDYEEYLTEKEKYKDLIYLGNRDEDNHTVKCPECGHTARLMEGFSLLAAGFNGVEEGDEEDINKQECGKCSAKLGW